MGICLNNSIETPTQDLIGTWIANQESRKFQLHSSPQRQSFKLNSTINPELIYKKLTIKPNGQIKYEESDHGVSFGIQGPAVKWNTDSVETANGSTLKIDYHKAKQGIIIVQNHKMYRA